jgi:SAM-dependent methyltransferase
MHDEMYDVHFNVQKHHWWFVVKERIVRDMIEACRLQGNPLDILDVGCGPGLMLEGLREYGNISGMDFSEKAVQYSQSKNIGDIRRGELPHSFAFKGKKFDLILALDVIEHIEEDVESLRVLHDALKPQGKIVLTVPAYQFLWSKHDEVNEHKRRYILSELRKKMASASLKVEKISYYNTFLFPLIFIARIFQMLLKMDTDSDLEIPPPFVNEALKMVFHAERLFLKRGVRFPFGVSLIAIAGKK